MADISRFTTLMQQRSSGYQHFTAEACLKRSEAGYEIVFGKVIAQRRGAEKVSRDPLDFGEYVYVASTFRLDELAPILQEQQPTFKIGQYQFVLKDALLRPHGISKMASNNPMTAWPTEVLELRPSSHNNYLNPSALVAHDCSRIFHDQYDGIRQYTGTNISFNFNNGLIGAMLFVLPDYRIRIRNIDASEQTLSVKLEKEQSFIGARLHCLVDGPGGRDEMARDIQEEDIVLKLKAPVEKLEIVRIFITSAADGVVDWYEQIPTFHSGGTRWITGQGEPSELDVVTEIRKGEGPHLEFKPFVKLGAGEKKAGELIRAALAFANTAGGTIYFGVSNFIEIEGIENDLRKAYATGDVTTAAHKYGREVQVFINDATSQRLDISWSVVTAEDHVLLRLQVAELQAGKPAWDVKTKEPWIRHGSNNVRPDPDTIRNGFRENSIIAQTTWSE
jgi:hypothetical protein